MMFLNTALVATPLESDGLSPRIREQLGLYNIVVGAVKFVANIILRNIPGRKRALEVEDEYIEAYFAKNGRYPPGNRNKK